LNKFGGKLLFGWCFITPKLSIINERVNISRDSSTKIYCSNCTVRKKRGIYHELSFNFKEICFLLYIESKKEEVIK